MSDASTGEQAGAGLDRLTPAEFERLQPLNAALSREIRLSVSLRRQGQHGSTIFCRPSNGASTAAPEAGIPGSARAGLPDRVASVCRTQSQEIDDGTICQRLETNYYGKGDVIVYRLNRDGQAPDGQQPRLRRQRQDAALRRRLLAHLHHRRQHRPDRHRFDEELHPARDPELHGLRSGILLPISWRAKFLETYPQAEGIQLSATRDSVRGAAGRQPSRSHPPARNAPLRASNCGATATVESWKRAPASTASGCCAWAAAPSTASCATSTPRCPTSTIARCTCGSISTGATSTPDAAFSEGTVTAQVRAHGARGLPLLRIGQHPAGHLSARDEDAGGDSRRSPKCIWKPTTAPGTPSRSRAIELGVYTDARPPYGCLGLTLQEIAWRDFPHTCSTRRAASPPPA